MFKKAIQKPLNEIAITAFISQTVDQNGFSSIEVSIKLTSDDPSKTSFLFRLDSIPHNQNTMVFILLGFTNESFVNLGSSVITTSLHFDSSIELSSSVKFAPTQKLQQFPFASFI